jgi:FdhD protein
MTAPVDELTLAILRELAGEAEGLALPRLGKRLGVGASVLMRRAALLGEAAMGGRPGPGWVRLEARPGGWRMALTAAGRTAIARTPA